MQAEFSEMLAALAASPGLEARWSALTVALADLGMDQVNYGVLDTRLIERMEAPVRFLSTMRPDWIAYYGEERLDRDDPHVVFVRSGNLMPYRWGESALGRLDDPAQRKAVALTVEAGLRAQISVTMADPLGSGAPVAGLTLGSSLSEAELAGEVAGSELALIALGNAFHLMSIGEVRRRHHGAKPLTVRERDCLTWLASGLRPGAIAERLGVARVTIDLHLRNARRKLGAATLPEAVAKAVLFQEIRLA